MSDLSNITQERAARRFAQIATLERQLATTLAVIAEMKAKVKETEKAAEALTARMRQAARDVGELPLFDLNE